MLTLRATLHTLGMGLCGWITGRMLQLAYGPDAGPWVPPNAELLLNSFIGGLVGGVFTIWAFGRSGWAGPVLAAVGAILATGLGGFVGGTLFGHTFGGILGMGALLEGLVFQPLILVPWVLAMAALHGLSASLRKQSISG